MAKSKKSKWIIGLTGTAFSAFVIGQIGSNQSNEGFQPNTLPLKSMSKEERKLAKLDWSNYSINGMETSLRGEKSDRRTRRS